jgi:hypothetical protein
MVEISLSGSGEGPGWATAPGYSTAGARTSGKPNSVKSADILAHPRGWVEITISDRYVPDVPPAEDSDDPWQRPSSCGVSVELNDEPILYGSACPSGDPNLTPGEVGP